MEENEQVKANGIVKEKTSRVVSFELPVGDIAAMQAFFRESGLKNASEAYRLAVREFLERHVEGDRAVV